MSVLDCFTGKIAKGIVNPDAGRRLTELIEAQRDELAKSTTREMAEFSAVLSVIDKSWDSAANKANTRYLNAKAQLNLINSIEDTEEFLTKLREMKRTFGNNAPGLPGRGFQSTTASAANWVARSFLAAMPFDITPYMNVTALSQFYRAQFHSRFQAGIEALRPKMLGFKQEAATGLDVLRASYGEAAATPNGNMLFKSLTQGFDFLADSFRGVGGVLAKMENYFPNPEIDNVAARTMGPERYKALLRDTLDRNKMIDYTTEKPMTDDRFERFLDEHAANVTGTGEVEPVTSGIPGRRMLGNARDYARVLQFKDADSWMKFAQTVGTHSDPFQAIVDHAHLLARDTAMIEILGPNPEAFRRFAKNWIGTEVDRLTTAAPAGASEAQIRRQRKLNESIINQVKVDQKSFDNLFDVVSGKANEPGNHRWAVAFAEARAWLAASQLGGVLISSFNDVANVLMASRQAGLPSTRIIGSALNIMARGDESLGIQVSLGADMSIGMLQRVGSEIGDAARFGWGSKFANSVMRASGQRLWTAAFKESLGTGWLLHLAERRGATWAEMAPQHAAFEAVGFTEADWNRLRGIKPEEPRAGAVMYDLRALTDQGETALAKKVSQLAQYSQAYGVIEANELQRAIMYGGLRPGEIPGEILKSFGQYKSFTFSLAMQQYGRMFSRGFDGSRMSTAAMHLIALTGFGMLSWQAKQLIAGKEVAPIDHYKPWVNALVQGGGLSMFGDLVLGEQVTKFGSNWTQTLAGPLPAAIDQVGRRWLVNNITAAANGKPTHFWGDAIYATSGLIPGSTLFPIRLAFQREVLDQLHMAAEGHRAKETMRSAERKYREDYHARYWWRPGQTAPEFAR